MTRRYNHILNDEGSIKSMVSCGLNKIVSHVNAALEEPLTLDELLAVVKRGKAHKLLGRDGICYEFCKTTWEASKQDMLGVMNRMYMDGTVSDAKKHGLIVFAKESRARRSRRL